MGNSGMLALARAFGSVAALAVTGCSSSGGPANTGPDATPGGSPAAAFGTCSDTPLRGSPEAPDPKAYTGGTCPTLTTGSSTESQIMSSGVQRKFMVIVPDAINPGEKLPVVFLWHWLGGSADQFYGIIDGQNAVNQGRYIAIIPEAIGGTSESPGSNAISKWRGWAAPNPQSMEDEEAAFFDDMLSCVSAQFPVNKNCVSSAGVSDGALWTSQLIGARADYLASAVVLSGGVADPGDENSALIKPYIPASRPLPVLVLWGGAADICIILKFQTATKALERHLVDEGHFILECDHNCGHSIPPIDVVAGESLLSPFIDFITHHPYWTPPGHSSYETAGLPVGLPSWCAIGAGSAVERTGACTSKLGCPVATTPAM